MWAFIDHQHMGYLVFHECFSKKVHIIHLKCSFITGYHFRTHNTSKKYDERKITIFKLILACDTMLLQTLCEKSLQWRSFDAYRVLLNCSSNFSIINIPQ